MSINYVAIKTEIIAPDGACCVPGFERVVLGLGPD